MEAAKKVFERAPLPVTEPPAVPSEAEVKAHRLTHIPYARWCSACVKTRARGDKHGSRKEVDRTPVVQVDFFFTTVDPDGRPEEEELPEHPCSLVAIDVDTRMVLAVPGPNKGGIALKRYVEELLRFTIALHDEEHIVLQSDGEPSIKAVVRATAEARASLGRRTTQRTTPTGDHQANGAAERAVQTVRRLGNTLVEDIEETYGKLPVGADLRLWAQPHAAFLYNRFHVCPHLQLTPYEAAFGGKPYAGRLCVFGETVYGKMVTPYKGGAQWIAGAWVGISPANGTHSILTDKGAIEAASVRRAATQEPPSKFCGLPWETASAVLRPKRAKRVGPVAVAFPVADEAPKGREDDEHGPSSDEEARAVEQAAQALESAKALEEKAPDEKAHPSDSSEEMIAGRGGPTFESRLAAETPRAGISRECRHQAQSRGSTERSTDQHQADPRGSTERGTDQHQADP